MCLGKWNNTVSALQPTISSQTKGSRGSTDEAQVTQGTNEDHFSINSHGNILIITSSLILSHPLY